MKRLEELAAEGNPAVQMVLPMTGAAGWRKQGVGELIRQAGLPLISLLMEEEVRDLVGERNQPQADRKANRWGHGRGYCVVMGQKAPIERPRVRSTDDREVRLGSYGLFHRGGPLTETVWEKLMRGLSRRRYGQAVRQFAEAYGREKSAISEHFIEASRAKLKQLMERRLEQMPFCALLIDAAPFEGPHMVVALGIGQDGRKTILGLRRRATENATVRGAQPGGRNGGNAHGAQASASAATAQDSGPHQCDRTGLRHRGAGLRPCETLACRGSARALGGIGTPGCGRTVPARQGTQTHPAAASPARSTHAFQGRSCQKEEGFVK